MITPHHLQTPKGLIQFLFINDWDKEEIELLYKSAGWWDDPIDNSIIRKIITGSYLFCVAVNTNNNAIGMGRILSDKISIGYIHDVHIVKPYQGMKIGTTLIQLLVHVFFSNCRHQLVLLAKPGVTSFYERQGFVSTKNTIFMQILPGAL